MPVVLGAASAITSRRVALYGVVSTLAAVAVVFNAFRQRSNFYSATVMLGGSNGCMMVLFNFGVFLALCVGFLCQKIFFGPLRAVEVEHLHERLWYAITESLLAMTIFRDDFDSSFAILFGTLLFLKVFHWLSADRVEYMEQSPSVSRVFHLRMIAVLSILFEFDLFLATFAVEVLIIDRNRKGIMIMFASEFFILGATLWSTIAKYLINCQDMRSEEPWQAKSMYVFVVDLITDFLKLATYLACFCLILSYYGLPLNIIRDVYMTGRSFFGRLRDFVKYRAATRNMDTRFPNASAADLRNMSDGTCIICREEMVAAEESADQSSGDEPGEESQRESRRPQAAQTSTSSSTGLNETPKKLPCGHIFHFHCLRSWLERQQSCPTCRRTVFTASDRDGNAINAGGGVDANTRNEAAPGHTRNANARNGELPGAAANATPTNTARERLQGFLQQLQTEAQRARDSHEEARDRANRDAGAADTGGRTATPTTSQQSSSSSGPNNHADAARSHARRMLINSLFAHQEHQTSQRKRPGDGSGSLLPPAPVLQGLQRARSEGGEHLNPDWIPPPPWTLRPDGRERNSSADVSSSSAQVKTDKKEETNSSAVEAEGTLDPEDAREAARAAALRRFGGKEAEASAKPSTSKEAVPPTTEEKPSLPGDPHLIPLFEVSSIADFDRYHAPRLQYPVLVQKNGSGVASSALASAYGPPERLASLALSTADLENLSQRTRKGLEERLRLLYRVEAAVGQMVEELTRALSVLPTDDVMDENGAPATSRDEKGKEPAEGIHAPLGG